MRFVRNILIVIFAFVVVLQAVGDILLPWKPFGTYGFSGDTSGRISAVRPDSPAARAGIRPGDRIDVANLTYHERRRLIYLSVSPPGETMTFPVIHDGSKRDVTLTSVVYARTAAENITDILETAERIAFMVIAVVLAIRRPSLLTFSFYCIALGSGGGASLNAWLSDAAMRPYAQVANAATIVGFCSSIIFAMMFPRLEASRSVVRTAYGLAILAVAWWLLNLRYGYMILFGWSSIYDPSALLVVQRLNALLPVVLYTAATIAYVVNYLRSSSTDRLRMRWVALGFIVGSLGSFGLPIVVSIFGVLPPLWIQNCVLLLNIFIPVTVAYAILRHHLLDVRFFLSRALVYSTITGVAVVALLLLEIFVAKQLEAYHLAVVIEVAGALAIGIGIHRLHAAVDTLVDRLVFRSFHSAELHLTNIGEAMMFATSAAQIQDMLCNESQRALDLSDVQVVSDVEESDQLALRLQASRSPIQDGSDLAVPFLVRHRLFGYARFSPHRNGAAIDPNERELLAGLCHRAALAYDHVQGERLAMENERLQVELHLAQARNDELRTIARSAS